MAKRTRKKRDAGKETGGKAPTVDAANYRNYKIAKLLLEAGANVDTTSKSGKNALYYAKRSKAKEIIKLIKHYTRKRAQEELVEKNE